MIIGLDDESQDLVTNYVPFMSLEAVENKHIEIIIKHEVQEAEKLKDSLLKTAQDFSDFGEDVVLTKQFEVIVTRLSERSSQCTPKV